MKLFTCITAFSGLEWLKYSIPNFLKFSDVVLCYQNISHAGRRKNIEDIIFPFESDRVHINKFEPKLDEKIRVNEMAKHTQMIKFAGELGATHFLMAAVDHFYIEGEVKDTMEEASEYDATFTMVHTYYKKPTWQFTPTVDFKMPYICKLKPETKICPVLNYPLFVDPAVKVNTYHKWKLFDIACHNYSLVRENIMEKFSGDLYQPLLWSKRKKQRLIDEWYNYDIEKNPGVEYWHGRKLQIVPDYFNLEGRP